METEITQKYQNIALDLSMSLSDLCAKAGVAASTVTRWRAGATPKGHTLRKIDDAVRKIAIEQMESQNAKM